ncbi:MAG TPA: amidohydrolase [Acidimicrobiia bacterium]|nr:amidohydrolase [Acidimicrobiia bacterium]
MYHDHHLHPFGYAALVNGLELMDAPDLETVMSRVAEHRNLVEGAIIGHRLNDEGVRELRLPTAADIDDVVGDRPVLLYRYCGHIGVANSAALALAGIDADTADPEGGSFDRDPSGRPNGILRETALSPVTRALEPHTTPTSDLEVVSALAGLRRLGIGSITGMVSVSSAVWCSVDDEVEALVRIARDLPIDIDVLLIASSPEDLGGAKAKLDAAEGPIRFAGYKDFIDGSLGGHTAAMYEPFTDRPGTRGTERYRHGHMVEMGETSIELGGSVAIHAIGDRAIDLALDVHEELIDGGADPGRLRVEHMSVVNEDSIERMARLGVTASIQPAFLASEASWLEKRLGSERMRRAYPFRSLLEAGVPLLGGSDSPVELPDPEIGIVAAVDRHGVNPDQSLTRDQAVALFTPPPA